MPIKKVIQDIISTDRRTIRSVPVRRLSISSIRDIKEDRENVGRENPRGKNRIIEEPNEEDRIVRKPKKTKSSSKFLLSFFIVFICIAIIGVALSLLYTKGVVTITPVTQEFNVNGTLTVKKESGVNDLRYDVITADHESSRTVPATNGPLIQTKAKGTITLYNNYLNTAQKIVAGTRISNSKGLIYRTLTTVSIPGKKVVSGKTVMGSISVAVIADQAGENYNMKAADLAGDFKIVAYKGTPKYSTIYGRIKTEITGGFSGTKKIVSSEILKKTETELKDEIKKELISQIKLIVPKDYTFFDDAYTIEYEVSEPGPIVSGISNFTIKGTIYGLIFNNKNLLKAIALKELKVFPTQSYDIKGLQDLNFEIKNIKDFSPKKGTSLTFSIKGHITLTGTFDEMDLKNNLRGISLKNSNEVFRKYSSISNAYAVITPFWMRAFPNSIDSIIIEYKAK
jgi:hypothetical protein